MNSTRCLTASLFVLVTISVCADEGANPPSIDFKPLFRSVGNYPLLSGGAKEGAVRLEEKDCVTGPPSLFFDCSRTKARVISVGFYIHPSKVAPWRGKSVVFRTKIKYLKGIGRLSLQMRAGNQKWAAPIATSTVFKGETGRWVPFELHCAVPPMEEIDIVNFTVWLENSQEPAMMLLDECTLSVEASPQAADGPATEFAAYASPPGAGPMVLIRDGKPLAKIVVSEPMTPSVRFAVQELNEHLELCSGTALPIAKAGEPVSGPTVHVGKTDLTERLGLAPGFLAPDSWTVRRVGDALILSGGDDANGVAPISNALVPFGTMYAVYEFLERSLGVRWYWPGKLGRVTPSAPTVEIGNVAWFGAPTYSTRFAFYAYPKDPDFTSQDVAVWWRRLRWGGVGGSPIGMHSFNDWSKRFGKEHPDWFALQRNGERAALDDHGWVCITEPEVLKQAVADKRAQFDKTPWMKYATVMPGDGMFDCQCARCQALVEPSKGPRGEWSKAVWTLVNNVAAEIRKSHPGRVITCCAYSSYREVPEDVHLLPNVAVTLCTNYLPNVWKPSCKSEYLKLIEDWSKKTEDIYVWDYWYARRHAGVFGAPCIFPRAMQEWFAMERGRVKGRVIELCEYYSDGRSSHDWADWMFDALNMYVAMRLMWDAEQDVDKMLDEYYTQLYGPAAPMVRKFYDELEAAWAHPKTTGGPDEEWDWNVCWMKTYPQEFVKRVMGYLREAEKMTRGQEPYHARVAKTLTGFLPFEACSRRYVGGAGAKVSNETIAVPEAVRVPVIDGKLDDACWKNAAPAEGFFDQFNNPNLRVQTFLRLVRDKDRLYIAVRCPLERQDVKQDLPPGSKDRWAWEEESVEIFFVQNNRKYQFIIGTGDVYADNFHPDINAKFSMDMFGWDCKGVEYKASLGEKEWSAEVAIPLSSLGLDAPAADKPWKVNFCRNYYFRAEGEKLWQSELSSWRPTFGSFHNIERFGDLLFR